MGANQHGAVPGGPGESQDKGKAAQEGFKNLGGPPRPSWAIFALLILAFPWTLDPPELPPARERERERERQREREREREREEP